MTGNEISCELSLSMRTVKVLGTRLALTGQVMLIVVCGGVELGGVVHPRGTVHAMLVGDVLGAGR